MCVYILEGVRRVKLQTYLYREREERNKRRRMARIDIRQLMAGVLTFSMFLMLCNMIMKDYFDSAIVNSPNLNIRVLKQDELESSSMRWPLNESTETPKLCLNKAALDRLKLSKGFITFSLKGGPEFHVSQVGNAISVARYLGATVVVPDIFGNEPGEKRKFEDMYDVHKFITSLNGIIKIASFQPPEVASNKPTPVRIPNEVSETYVSTKLLPLFERKKSLKLITYFPNSSMSSIKVKRYMNPVSCLVAFKALRLQPELQEVINSMLESLRTLSKISDGRFVAIDTRIEMMRPRGCQESGTSRRKSCFSNQEIVQFLKRTGFERNTTIYVTQDGWDDNLDVLKDIYPNTYTKSSLVIATGEAEKFLSSETSEFTKMIDFQICSNSDVFVPSSSNLFYATVVGERIALGKTNVLVPFDSTSAAAVDYLSPYISKKSHPAYSCLC